MNVPGGQSGNLVAHGEMGAAGGLDASSACRASMTIEHHYKVEAHDCDGNLKWIEEFTARPRRGWSDSSIRLWQPLGLAHDCFHVDYSQNLRLIGAKVQIDGDERDFDEVVQDTRLCALLSAEGPLRVRRQPSVPAESKAFPEMPDAPAAGILRAARGEWPLSIPCRDRGIRPGPVRWVVIHASGPLDGPNTALELATKYASSTGTALRSVHYILDRSNVIACVKEDRIAFAVAGANEAGIHVELAGAARWSAEDWATAGATDIIENVARVVGATCKYHEIPIEFVDADGLRAGKNGITTRAEVAKAWARTKARDPGPFFPMDRLCELARG